MGVGKGGACEKLERSGLPKVGIHTQQQFVNT